uniref:Putative golgi apparatus n=1 Tax=Ixodes ricinus TaxID=34613 RepID=V5HLY1_IXORI
MAAPSAEKPSTLLVKNLPPDTKESKLEEIFGDIGPLKRCFIVRDKSDKAECKGVAYVTYASAADAEAALTQKFKLGENLLHVKLAASKPLRGSAAAQKSAPRPKATKEERLARKKRKPRLIVRNLSFKANEDVLRDCFGKYGDLVEVSIPKKPDGKMRGFAFVQFAETKSAIKAINGLNASNISGRPVAVDFCLPKATYQNATQGQASASKAEGSNDGSEDTDGSADEASVVSEAPAHEDSASDSDQGDNTDQDMDDEQSEEEDGSDEEDEDDDESRHERKSQPGDTKNTLFVRNISFETTQESLDSLMKQFGPCKYCLLCTDPVTEHSKGSAFVRYVKDASVERCLQAAQSSAGLMLDGRRLSVARALSREELDAKRESEKKAEEGSPQPLPGARRTRAARHGSSPRGLPAGHDQEGKAAVPQAQASPESPLLCVTDPPVRPQPAALRRRPEAARPVSPERSQGRTNYRGPRDAQPEDAQCRVARLRLCDVWPTRRRARGSAEAQQQPGNLRPQEEAYRRVLSREQGCSGRQGTTSATQQAKDQGGRREDWISSGFPTSGYGCGCSGREAGSPFMGGCSQS